MTNTVFRKFAFIAFPAAALAFFFAIFLLKQGYLGEPIRIAKLVDGATYTGNIQDGQLQGKGTLHWPQGGTYVGQFKDGLLHGEGEYIDMLGTRYAGQFVEGQFTGTGTIYSQDRGIYEGQTRDWQMQGKGEYRLEKTIYRGTFVGDALAGQGEHLEDGKPVYRGEFRDWVYHGEGERFDEDGQWQGIFEDGLMISGTHKASTGDRYEGEISFRQYHGDGELTLANGDRYIGGFRYGDFHGDGTMYLTEAREGVTEYSGTWRKGRLVASPQSHLVEDYEADLELALYRETDLLKTELRGVPAGDPRQVEVYFLGIAGDGTERVFSREVTALRDHFDSLQPLGKRQINLINDRETIGKRPMATSISIAQAIATLGARMNLDQDLLVLYISSHGSSTHEISLQNEAIGFGDLSAKSLSAMLKKSDIRWQVIFVSACYSGGFIEPLRTDSTLIMTAAASDKTSFGCSDEAEMTYFGQALLESLSKSKTFAEAYEILAGKIAAREAEEDLTSSEPQLHVGDEIAEKLQTFPGLFKGLL